MVKTSGRQWRSAIGPALALAIVLGGPAIVRGQLFPNRNIRRERPPCVGEPPFYPLVRQQYYGYYPTCWRKFPPGWACPCPNPELPNWQASLEKFPLKPDTGPKNADKPDEPLDSPDRKPSDPMTDPMVPPVSPDATSPFEKDPFGKDPKPESPPPLDDRPAPRRGGAAGLPPRTEVTPATTTRPATEVASAQPAPIVEASSPSALPPLILTDDEASPSSTTVANGAGTTLEPPPANLPGPSAITDATPTPAPLAPTVQAPARRSILGNLFGRTRRR